MSSTTKKDRFRILRIIKNIVLGTLIVFLTVILIVTIVSRIMGRSPSLFGFSLYRVSSGSMVPSLEVGDIILVQSCDGSTVKENDVITYTGTTGVMAGKEVTHRVVKAPYQEGAETYIVTRGDANLKDDEPIRVSQVKGRLVLKLTLLKFLFDFFLTPWGLLVLIALIILAFFNEILNFVKALFGFGMEEPKESVDELIARYQREGADSGNQEESLPEDTDEKKNV